HTLRLLPSFPTRRSSDLYDTSAWPFITNCTISCRFTAWATARRTRTSLKTSFSMLKPIWLEDSRGIDVTLTPLPSRRPMCWGERSEEHTSELQSRFDLVC